MLQIWHKLNSSKPTWALPEPDDRPRPVSRAPAIINESRSGPPEGNDGVAMRVPWGCKGTRPIRHRRAGAVVEAAGDCSSKKLVKGSALPLLPEVRVHQNTGIRRTPKTKGPIEKPELPAGLEPINRRQAPALRNVERFAVFVFDRDPRSDIVRLVRVVTNRLDTVARNESIRPLPVNDVVEASRGGRNHQAVGPSEGAWRTSRKASCPACAQRGRPTPITAALIIVLVGSMILPLAWQGALSRFVLRSYFLFCFIFSPVDASVATRSFSR
jgi:hypothetical protein